MCHAILLEVRDYVKVLINFIRHEFVLVCVDVKAVTFGRNSEAVRDVSLSRLTPHQ